MGVEIQVSRHAACVAGNFSLSAPHKLYPRVLGARDDEDALEFDGCVHYTTGIRPSLPDPLSKRRDNPSWPGVPALKLRSFVADARGVGQFFLRLRPRLSAIFRRRGQDKSFRPSALQIAST